MGLIGGSSFVLAMSQNEVTPYLNKANTYLKTQQMELNTLPKIEITDQLPTMAISTEIEIHYKFHLISMKFNCN